MYNAISNVCMFRFVSKDNTAKSKNNCTSDPSKLVSFWQVPSGNTKIEQFEFCHAKVHFFQKVIKIVSERVRSIGESTKYRKIYKILKRLQGFKKTTRFRRDYKVSKKLQDIEEIVLL